MELETITSNYRQQVQAVKELFEEKINKLKRGDELPPGVIKMVKVYIAVKRKLQVGDKMAAGTETRVWSLGFFPRRICLTSRTEPRWILS